DRSGVAAPGRACSRLRHWLQLHAHSKLLSRRTPITLPTRPRVPTRRRLVSLLLLRRARARRELPTTFLNASDAKTLSQVLAGLRKATACHAGGRVTRGSRLTTIKLAQLLKPFALARRATLQAKRAARLQQPPRPL